jgi:hypothetical protein
MDFVYIYQRHLSVYVPVRSVSQPKRMEESDTSQIIHFLNNPAMSGLKKRIRRNEDSAMADGSNDNKMKRFDPT